MGLNGLKSSGEIDTKYVSGPFIFGCEIRPGSTLICKV